MVLTVLGLDVKYGRRTVVSDLDLSVRHGEVGLRSIVKRMWQCEHAERDLRLVAPDCGEVLVNGFPLAPDMGAAAAAGVGMVPATRNVFDDLRCARTEAGRRQEPDAPRSDRRTARVLALFPN